MDVRPRDSLERSRDRQLRAEGEKAYGRKNFLELFSVFLSPPLFSILHGRQELGFVDELTFLGKTTAHESSSWADELGWSTTSTGSDDWRTSKRRTPRDNLAGKGGPAASIILSVSRSSRSCSQSGNERWSRRAAEQIEEIRNEFSWLEADSTVVLMGRSGEPEWWTFGGTRANATLARAFADATQSRVEHDGFTLTFESRLSHDDIQQAVKEVRSMTSLQCGR